MYSQVDATRFVSYKLSALYEDYKILETIDLLYICLLVICRDNSENETVILHVHQSI